VNRQGDDEHKKGYSSYLAEKESVALGVSATLSTLFEFLPCFEFLPNTRGIDVLVLLIPSSIHDLGERRIVVVAL